MQHLRDTLGFVHLQGHVRHWLEQPDQVKCLTAIAVDVVARHVPGDDHDRCAPLVGQSNAGKEVDRPWPGSRNAHGRLPRGAGVAVGHERCAFFVPRVDEADIASAVHLCHNTVCGRTHDAKRIFNAFCP